MNTTTENPPACPGHEWISTLDLKPGAILARAARIWSGTNSVILAEVGTSVTAGLIADLLSHGIECIAVVSDAAIDEKTNLTLRAQHDARVREIFGSSPNKDCLALMSALIKDGPEC